MQRPGEMPPDASHGRRFRNSKPPSDSAPKPNKNAAPHHPRNLFNVAFWSPKRRSDTAKATTRRDASRYIPGRRFRNSKPPSESAQNQTKTQRHTTHENSLTSLSEALKEEVTPPRQRPGEMPPDASHGRRFRNSKPPSDSAPKPDRNAAPHHPRILSNVAFWSPKRRSYTAKATTRRDASRCIPWPPLPQQQTTIRLRPKTKQKRSATPPTKTL